MWWSWCRFNWRRRKTIRTQKCNAIFSNVIFMDEIIKKKYLFYNCYVNWCYCVVHAAFNLSILREDRQGIQTQIVIYCENHRRKHRRFVSAGVFLRGRELFPHHWWKHRRFVSVGVFQRQRELFTSHVGDVN